MTDLPRRVDEWLQHGTISLHSGATTEQRRIYMRRLKRYLEAKGCIVCGGDELLGFFAQVRNERTGAPLKIEYIETLRRAFSAFWNWLAEKGYVAVSAMDAVPPIAAAKRRATEQVQPFGETQWRMILDNTRKSPFPVRDAALVYFTLDTGLRASELCSLRLCNLDMTERSARVVGKGDKERTVFFQPETCGKLWDWFRERKVSPEDDPDAYLFVGVSGPSTGQPMTRSGIRQAIAKIVKRCGITDGKCGPHRLRHTFATEMIKNGAYQDAVQHQLGHSNAKMTQRYVTLARADMKNQHGKFSPIAARKRG